MSSILLICGPGLSAHRKKRFAMPLHENGPVSIHYEEAGAGFPLLLIPGGGVQGRGPLAVRHARSFLRAHQPAENLI